MYQRYDQNDDKLKSYFLIGQKFYEEKNKQINEKYDILNAIANNTVTYEMMESRYYIKMISKQLECKYDYNDITKQYTTKSIVFNKYFQLNLYNVSNIEIYKYYSSKYSLDENIIKNLDNININNLIHNIIKYKKYIVNYLNLYIIFIILIFFIYFLLLSVKNNKLYLLFSTLTLMVLLPLILIIHILFFIYMKDREQNFKQLYILLFFHIINILSIIILTIIFYTYILREFYNIVLFLFLYILLNINFLSGIYIAYGIIRLFKDFNIINGYYTKKFNNDKYNYYSDLIFFYFK